MKFIIAFFLAINVCHAQNNYVYIDQVGNNNQVTITQDGTGHVAAVAIGSTLPTNTNDLKTGYGIGTNPYNGIGVSEYNNITISQQGVGSQTTTIELPRASNNLINLDQSGAGNHTFSLTATSNTNNINNTITATQSGTGDKLFALTLDGTNGASVTIQQTNPTQANSGSMTIQCVTCGAYSYIRN